MSYLERLRLAEKNGERPPPPSAKSAKTPLKATFGTFGTSPPGPFSVFFPDVAPAPALNGLALEAIREAIAERAAIREFDGGGSRPLAEHQAHAAMRVYQVLVAMDPGQPPRWATLLAPGCELAEATHAAQGRFGPERVLEIHERPFPTPGTQPMVA